MNKKLLSILLCGLLMGSATMQASWKGDTIRAGRSFAFLALTVVAFKAHHAMYKKDPKNKVSKSEYTENSFMLDIVLFCLGCGFFVGGAAHLIHAVDGK